MPTTFQLVRAHLDQSRRAGISFDVAWDLALESVPRPRSRLDGYEWKDDMVALEATKRRWAASYRRKQSGRRDRALVMVSMRE